jgi:HEAT repeat protein
MVAVAVALLLLLGLVGAVIYWYQRQVEGERVLKTRFDDPQGHAGLSSSRVAALGDRAVPTLVEDLKSAEGDRRYKAMELLGAIDDPRVIPALAPLLTDKNVSVRLAGIAALARTGKHEAVERLWPLLQGAADVERQRVLVALGLVCSDADFDKLEAAAKAAQGFDRTLLAWSLGHAQRRAVSFKLGNKGYVPPAPEPIDLADSERIQTQMSETLAQIDAGKDLRAAGLKLAELTDVNTSTWDIGHQIALQVLAVSGPGQFRRAHAAEQAPVQGGLQLRGTERARPVAP